MMMRAAPADILLTPESAQRLQSEMHRLHRSLSWTVHAHPRDYPDAFIARPHEIAHGRVALLTCHLRAASIKELREQLPAGLYRMDRLAWDAPGIIEVWF